MVDEEVSQAGNIILAELGLMLEPFADEVETLIDRVIP